MPFDLLQEWGFRHQPFDDLGFALEGERIIHAIADPSRERVIMSTEGHLISLNIENGRIEVIAEIAGSGRLGLVIK